MQFDFGDEVVRVGVDGTETGQPGAVVEFTEVKFPEQIQRYGYPLGTILCTVEFGDGTAQMIPESDLRIYDPRIGE